jgi:hypothetical protein
MRRIRRDTPATPRAHSNDPSSPDARHIVGGLEKSQQHVIGIRCLPHGVVRKHEFPGRLVEERRIGHDFGENTRAEVLQHPIDLTERAPEPAEGVGIQEACAVSVANGMGSLTSLGLPLNFVLTPRSSVSARKRR